MRAYVARLAAGREARLSFLSLDILLEAVGTLTPRLRVAVLRPAITGACQANHRPGNRGHADGEMAVGNGAASSATRNDSVGVGVGVGGIE